MSGSKYYDFIKKIGMKEEANIVEGLKKKANIQDLVFADKDTAELKKLLLQANLAEEQYKNEKLHQEQNAKKARSKLNECREYFNEMFKDVEYSLHSLLDILDGDEFDNTADLVAKLLPGEITDPQLKEKRKDLEEILDVASAARRTIFTYNELDDAIRAEQDKAANLGRVIKRRESGSTITDVVKNVQNTRPTKPVPLPVPEDDDEPEGRPRRRVPYIG